MSDNEESTRPARLLITHHTVDGVRVVALAGEIDHTSRDVLSAALMPPHGAASPRIVADLEGVTFLDSSGINILIVAHRQAAGAQGWLRIAGAQDAVLRVLTLVGIDTFIPCHPTLDQALTA
ncbi:STAS domain-containing protein [Streptomyces sp. NPDC002057]|uniref:STAS domain-containing protein n=1 Tax=Streptomyces sp. NPDC002057 TaxID=3154664 RepID=UPI00332D3C87